MSPRLLIPFTLLVLVTACQEGPSTLESQLTDYAADNTTLRFEGVEYDFFSRTLFISVFHPTADSSIQVTAWAYPRDSNKANLDTLSLSLADNGESPDAWPGDGIFSGSIVLDSLTSSRVRWFYLQVTFLHEQPSLDSLLSLTPPQPPQITTIQHHDTLYLQPDQLVLDTLRVRVDHPEGPGAVRSVVMFSLKPDSTYANHGAPIPLYDDGGATVLFEYQNQVYNDGDRYAGDGEYSLLLALTPQTLTGRYLWSFVARAWNGLTSDTLRDTLWVLPPQGGGQ